MCGIIGITENSKEKVARGMELLRHRGPDDEGIYSDDVMTVGHCRLSIIDLSPLGHQPMVSLAGYAISFNGEIYNYKELKAELIKKGATFRGESDTEVILEGYRIEGGSFLGKMRGMWALAIYDSKKKEVILSCDHFGIKPIYYIVYNNKLAFASEIKALKKIAGPFSLNTEKYYQFFNLGYFIGENTYYKEVKKVRPGEVLTWKIAGSTLSREFLSMNAYEKNEDLTFDQAVELIHTALIDSVEKHYVADVPVGLLLSGGTDSSLVAALSKKIGKAPICYHVAVPGSIDTEYARKISKYVGFNLIEKELSQEALTQGYNEMDKWLDMPTSDVSIIPTALVYKSVNKESKVVLSGEGGDELFGGYLRHNEFAALNKLNGAHSIVSSFYSPSSFGLNFTNPLVRRVEEKLNSDIISSYLRNTKTLGFPIEEKKIKKEFLNYYEKHPYKDLVPANLFFDQFMYLSYSLMNKNDITSMNSSIEARVPFVDKEVLEAVSSLPNKYRLSKEYSNKKLLKAVLKKYLPDELVERPKKGFGFSFDRFESSFLINDYKKASKFHIENSTDFALDSNLKKILSEANATTICKKFPRFAFSLITNYKLVERS